MSQGKKTGEPVDNVWDASKIKGLRRRLGWSQSDLARRLSCDSNSVKFWEEASATPTEVQSSALHMIFQQAELVAHEMTQSVQAEANLHQNALEFIEVQTFDLPDKN